MSKPKEKKEEVHHEVGKCPFCEASTEEKGHVVEDGKVTACPHIDMIMQPGTLRF